jgi:hypothetical protein
MVMAEPKPRVKIGRSCSLAPRRLTFSRNPERAEDHHQASHAPFLEGITKQVLALLENPPLNQLDRLAEGIVAQPAEKTDDHGQNDQEGVFTDAEGALQGGQGVPQPGDDVT